ncbi:Down syndrome cell adhesion molecule-like protein Dscam2 [Ischnura elegans]|uniref:Down syndrome cell adhesion molecule-like protein Dscam2 n=1 Tax=Ischnura elegans TaxID=197161 RepID=UPI001ED8B278|nr:Down syndrome cell adhesion molecule-like protein Dscam2 [Ischnura elegans]
MSAEGGRSAGGEGGDVLRRPLRRRPRLILHLVTLAAAPLLLAGIEATFLESQGPTFIKEPPSRVDFANVTGARIDCSAQGSPPPAVHWVTQEGKPVRRIPDTRDTLANGSLLFLPFRPGTYRQDVHQTTYKCVASNSVGRIVSRDVRVRAVVLQDYDVQVIYSKKVMRGNTAILKCTISNFVREYITVTSWVQDSTFNIYPSIKGDGKYHMLPSGELLIRNVDEGDKYRSYQCRAVNRLTGSTLLSVDRARFMVIDTGITSAPRTMERQSTAVVRKDHSVVLPCLAEGHPPPAIRWFRQDRHQLHGLEEDERVFRVAECLVILHAEEADAGRYVCVANNSAGAERVEVSLAVSSSPLAVSLHPRHAVVDAGHRAEFRCHVSGARPGASISWLKDGQPVGGAGSGPGSRVSVDGGERLVVDRVQREDAGMYQCMVRADEDSAQGSAELRLGAAHPILIYKFISQTLQPGPPVSLKCIATGNPTPQMRWTLDGFALPQSERFLIGQYVTVHGDVISHVNISNVQVEDGGIYQCTARNRVGEVMHSADLRIYGLPSIRQMPNVSAVAGESLYITCPVAGYPIDTVSWEKGGRKLPLNRRQRVFSNGTLRIENVQRAPDRGLYRCTASNKQGRSAFQSVNINVIVPPRIAPFTFQTDLHLGDRAGVQCIINKGDLPLDIQWHKDGVPVDAAASAASSPSAAPAAPALPPLSVRRLSDFVSLLTIDSLRPEHAGNYSCLASNDAAQASHSSMLLVNVPPRWLREPKDQNVTVGGSVTFECQAEGFPNPSVIWRKVIGRQPSEYQDLTLRSRGIHLLLNGSLQIKQALQEHQGQYLCEASNGIGAGLSSVVQLTVHVPPEFEVKSAHASVRRGAPEALTCEARGDAPMSIAWLKDGGRMLAHAEPRFQIRESPMKDSFLSELIISRTVKSDSGTYTCVATNPYGRDQRTVQLQVKDAPGRPLGVRIASSGSRNVRIGWMGPTDEDRSPALHYTVQYIEDSAIEQGWSGAVAAEQPAAPGLEQWAQISGLRPATLYRFRVLASNELGAGEPSEEALVRTEGEAPAGPPRALAAHALASTEVRVTWAPPPAELWNGDILGYYVGYRENGIGRSSGYNFTTVQFNANKGGVVVLTNLKKFRKYGIVVQAFNEKGPGPMSNEIVTQTLEDVPTAPPLEIECMSRTTQSLFIRWQPPPQLFQNGVIQGYKIYYENVEEWPPGHIEADTKMTIDLSTEIHGLQKYSNYSVQVWGYTRVGDGVKSKPIFCHTEEDVPEAPAAIKVVPSSPTSLTLSWLPPSRPNGILTAYHIYTRVLEGGSERTSYKKRVIAARTRYDATDLRQKDAYEFWVTALTRVGEGPSTRVVYATPSSKVPAAILSFGQVISVLRRSSVLLPCMIVGSPEPERAWVSSEGNPISGSHFAVQPDGALFISDAQRRYEGNYTCTAQNSEGSDMITYTLRVQVAPSAPHIYVTSTSTTSLHLQWTAGDMGGSAIRGYILNYKHEPGEWEKRVLPRSATGYKLEDLACGSEYRLYLMAYNSVGSGAPSETIMAATDGSPPGKPLQREFVTPNTSSVTLNMRRWEDNGCEISHFVIEYKESAQEDWIKVDNNVLPKDNFPIMGLWPATEYVVRVTAFNSAGSTEAEYTFGTLPIFGGTFTPSIVDVDMEEASSFYLDIGLIVPIVISLLAIIGVTIAVFICIRRKPPAEVECAGIEDGQSIVSIDNKQNMAQREQYYAAVQKGIPTPVRDVNTLERIPEYAEDIYPYATFHVQSQQQTSSPAHFQTFVYHDQRLAAMETIPLKSSPHDDYAKLRQNRKRKCLRSESEDYDSLGSDSDTESQTESSNHLYDLGPSGDRLAHQNVPQCHNILQPPPESSTSTEPSPLPDRRNMPRWGIPSHGRSGRRGRRASNRSTLSEETSFGFPARLEPPSGFSDGLELSEAECDRDTLRHLKGNLKSSSPMPCSMKGSSRGHVSEGDTGNTPLGVPGGGIIHEQRQRNFTIAV